MTLRCDACHRVRRTTGAVLSGNVGGPDLTHLASRARLGAGVVANDAVGFGAVV